MRGLRRRLLIGAAVVITLAAGYTTGFLLAPRQPEAVSRTIPEAPLELPQPETPLELPDDV
jgi:hypothetical protein